MASRQLTKAAIINLATNERVVCMFNPTDYVFAKTNTWNEVRVESKNVPTLEFGGGQPARLDIELLFDTYEAHTSAQLSVQAGQDVRTYTKGLWDMMKVRSDGNHKVEPPRCRFEWGSLWSFEAVITSMSQKFTLFAADGTPLRAILSVGFLQIQDEGQYPRQNPTSGGQTGERLYVVREGELLDMIAYQQYGDSAAWRHIAETNKIDDPRRLQPGRTLILQPLPNR